MIISHWILHRIRNVSRQKLQRKLKHNYMFNNKFQKSCHLCSNMEKHGRVGQDTDNSIIQHRHIGCWMNVATKTHSEYVILIASLWKKRLYARISVLHYTNNAYPVPQSFQANTRMTNLSLCLMKYHSIKTYGEIEVQLHAFLTLALDWDKWSASNTSHFTTKEILTMRLVWMVWGRNNTVPKIPLSCSL
jgi:hypothetical protein